MKLGVCYYPEHWPESWWEEDARRMAELGLTYVRIGEFAWSRMEPESGRHDWAWLDRAIETLARHGLKIVLCTPTATPPKWLIDAEPDILALDRHGRPRGFGSRRHYCFSSMTYRRECARIVTAMAERYGAHEAVAAWQTDNEYGCHDTVLSYSRAARLAFRAWLRAKYETVDALNAAWGAVFWSQDYRSFEEVDPPVATVTEANPSHRLDYQRFASSEVAAFNKLQTDILRAHAPGRALIHNYMGAFTQFDHYDVARDLDVAAWDSYPLGFLNGFPFTQAEKLRYLRQGHPDFTAFHHDLYRGVGAGRMWVMEQQPGPVNWARWNPAPLPGMVRAWTWEAFAHGAETVSYFRWRQAPFAQEQMHAGLHTPDRREAPAYAEARQVAEELKGLPALHTARAPVALLFDYEAAWTFEIQPQGADFHYLALVLAFYGAARRCGLDVDVVSKSAPLDGYKLVLVPSLPSPPPDFAARAHESGARIILGPRSGAKTADLHIPSTLPPGDLRALIDLRVALVESLPPGHVEPGDFPVTRWLEHVETALAPRARTQSGLGLWYAQGRTHYVAAWPGADFLDAVLREAAGAAGLAYLALPDDLRLRRRGGLRFAINYAPEALDLTRHVPGAGAFDYVLGGAHLPPAGVAAWREA